MPLLFIKYILFIICGMLTGTGMAQVKYKTEYFTSEDGLSHRIVSTMFKDDDGFMWLMCSEISCNSGFNNPEYFSTRFKERFGLFSTDYLKGKK